LPLKDEGMRYRLLALALVLGLSPSFSATAKTHCSAGKFYVRSIHVCIPKRVAIERGIYHHSKRHRSELVAELPLPPLRPKSLAPAYAPPKRKNAENRPVLSSALEKGPSPSSPYGALVAFERRPSPSSPYGTLVPLRPISNSR